MNNLNQFSMPASSNLYAICVKSLMAFLMTLTFLVNVNAQTTNETFSTGSFIINMGVTPQTRNNALKPYGLIYDLLNSHQVPIKWIISPTKAKDGVDFTHNGISYKGGPFIIPAEFRSAAVNATISSWQSQGVVGATTVSPITVPVYSTLYIVPKWALDKDNGSIAVDFFTAAGIPSLAYGGSSSGNWPDPQTLDCCDDLFIMPHADPKWSTHSNLLTWNATCKGAIWLGCHAGSALEDMFNPANPSQQTNFLAEKTGTAVGGGPYDDNALQLWDDHGDGTLPYSYAYPNEPVMQFMGSLDKATTNGSEQIYLPQSAGWRPTTFVGVYDPDHPDRISGAHQHKAAVLAWGRGLGDSNRGYVMLEAGHDLYKEAKPDNIAALRAFFNFSYLALLDKAVLPSITGLGGTLNSGSSTSFSFTVPPPAQTNQFSVTWSSSCGGSFSPNNTSATVTYTAPTVTSSTPCVISILVEDPCGRQTFDTKSITVQPCNLTITSNNTNLCAGTNNTGVIDMNIMGGTAPYSYTWTRSGGGTGSGTGTTITGLNSGTYTINVTADDGCLGSLTTTLAVSPAINIAGTVTPVSCNGGDDGAISLTVSGGVPGYTYNWGGGITTKNRSGLSAGNYTVTVTDADGCTEFNTFNVTSTAGITINPAITHLECYDIPTGSITLNVTGGTAPYNFIWNDGSTSQNRTGLAAGTYGVTVTDANNCTGTASAIIVNQPSAPLSASSTVTNISCNGAADGSITTVVSGGTMPYSYDWNGTPNGDGTNTITDLGPGTYVLTVTDANSCVLFSSNTVTQGAALEISLDGTPPDCPPGSTPPLGSNGEIDLNVAGGASPYTYSWTTADGSGLNPTSQDQTGLTAGTYNVTVTDANGCTKSSSITLMYINPSPNQPGEIEGN